MKGPELFKVSMLTCALALAGCGGSDINLNVEGETVVAPSPSIPPTGGTDKVLAGVHSPSLSATVSAAKVTSVSTCPSKATCKVEALCPFG